jgi:hypothetical protein
MKTEIFASVFNKKMIKKYLYFFIPFCVAFYFLIYVQMGFGIMMPGNLGDARLNNYFLENIFQFLNGRSESLWSFGFWAPYQYLIGFSDNLFGASPLYLIPRFASAKSDTAFQIWFIASYFLNYGSAYYVFRRLGIGSLAASLGGLIFAFGLPTTSHMGHAQLSYRFCVPLSMYYLIEFFNKKKFSLISLSFLYLVWQFYCSVYIGFFLILLLFGAVIGYFFSMVCKSPSILKLRVKNIHSSFIDSSKKEKYIFLSSLILFALLLVILFYPYFMVVRLYGESRSWADISPMLPRLQSYLLNDSSYIWRLLNWKPFFSEFFVALPMRHEHQMFAGLMPIILGICGYHISRKEPPSFYSSVMGLSFLIPFILTLYVGGFSLWYFLYKLPLFSAIRAVARVELVLLFPIAYFSSVSIDYIFNRNGKIGKLFAVLLIAITIFELAYAELSLSPKEQWRSRILEKTTLISPEIPRDAILFFPQYTQYFDYIEAMLIYQNIGLKTLNGYSGGSPKSMTTIFGNDCGEVLERINGFIAYSGQINKNINSFVSRIVPTGFDNCSFLNQSINHTPTYIQREYKGSEINKIALRNTTSGSFGDYFYIDIEVINNGKNIIPAKSSIGKPLRIAWRLVDAKNGSKSDWIGRKNLNEDLLPGVASKLRIIFEKKSLDHNKYFEFTIVQEHVFWGHDIGLKLLRVDPATERNPLALVNKPL